MPRGKPQQVTLRLEDGREVVGEQVHAHAVLPVEDVAAVRDYARSTNEGYAGLLERLLREALAPVVRAAHEARQEREAVLAEKTRRAEELKRLIEQSREELRQLEQAARRRSGE